MTKPRPNIYEAIQAATEESVRRVVELAFDEAADDDVRFHAQALVEYCCIDKPDSGVH